MQAYFRPEMLNRLDEVVVFRQLDRQSVRRIADLVLAGTASQLAKKNIKLDVSPAVMAKIVEEGYDQVRLIQNCFHGCTEQAAYLAAVLQMHAMNVFGIVSVSWPDLLQWLFLQAYGARPLRRAVANIIESALSDALLHQQIVSGDTARLECDATGQVFVSLQHTYEPLRNSIVQAEGLMNKLKADVRKDVVNA